MKVSVHVCILGMSILPLSTILILDFGTVRTESVVFFVFHFIIYVGTPEYGTFVFSAASYKPFQRVSAISYRTKYNVNTQVALWSECFMYGNDPCGNQWL